MNVIFHTNVDAKFGGWYFPKTVCCRPIIGDLIESTNGDQTLQVCAITHCERKSDGNDIDDDRSYLKIELKKWRYHN